MPDSRLEKTRATLPAGYQYGDAGKPAIRIRYLRQFDISTPEQSTRFTEYQSLHQPITMRESCK